MVRQEKKSLREIVTESAIMGVLSYPIYAAVSSAIKPETFVEKLQDKETLYFSLGFMGVKILYEGGRRAYQEVKERRTDR